MNKLRNTHLFFFHNWFSRDVAFNRCERACSVFTWMTSMALWYGLQSREQKRDKPQPRCVSGCLPGTIELSFDRSFRLWQQRKDSGISFKAGKQSKCGDSASYLIHRRCPGWCSCTCQLQWVEGAHGCVRRGISFLSAAAWENALLTQRVASLLRTVYF